MQYVGCRTNPEGAVRLNGTDEIAFHRVPFVAAATTIVMVALLSHFPYCSATIDSKTVNHVDSRPTLAQTLEIEKISFVTSPTIDTDPKFFFGTGDGSNGYYAERPRSR
jgi:hypothetical protein